MKIAQGRRLVVVALAAVLLASCGVDTGTTVATASYEGESGAEQIAQAAVAMKDINSMKMSIDTAMSGSPIKFSMAGTGEYDLAKKLGHLKVESEGLGSGPAGDIEMILSGDTAYMKLADAKITKDGKPWAKLDLTDAKAMAGGGAVGEPTDPTSFTKLLEQITGKVETVGHEDVRGVPTTRVHATIDMGKALDAAAKEAGNLPKGGQDMQDMIEAMSGMMRDMFSDVPVDVWIDDEGRIRRLEITISMSGMAKAADGMKMVETIEMYDFDKPVEVSVPPASQVGELDFGALGD